MKLIYLLILSFSLNSFSQVGKVAFVLGDDHPTGPQFLYDNNVEAFNTLKDSGYSVNSFFGNTQRAQKLAKDANNPRAKALSLKNINDSISKIYDLPCEKRPKQLLLNFVAHGSRNGRGGTNHSINTSVIDSNGKIESKRIYVEDIADHLRDQKRKNTSCPYPKVGLIDYSCKSGGSVDVFKDLGCTLTTTSSYNATKVVSMPETFKKIKDNKGKSLRDLHLDMLLNRSYDLVEENYGGDKTTLEKMFDNSNQISGCSDENKINYAANSDYGKFISTPSCQSTIGILKARRESEIDTISSIVSKLNLKSGVDKAEMANIMKIDPSSIPNSEELSQKLNQLIEEDEAEFNKLSPLLEKESQMIASLSESPVSCELKTVSKGFTNMTDRKLRDPNQVEKVYEQICFALFPYDVQADKKRRKKMESAGKKYYALKDKRDSQKCSLSYRSKRLYIEPAKLIKYHKENIIQKNVRKELGQYKKLSQVGVDSNHGQYLEILNETVSSCIKDHPKDFAQYNANYKEAKDGCTQNTISCHMLKAAKREEEIKRHLAFARGYQFLKCEKSIKDKSDDLKACADFEI